MNPEEQQKADAWMLLTDKDAVTNRIGKVMAEIFENPSSARWLSQRLINADKQSISPPLKVYFEQQLERNLRMILAEGVHDRLAEIMRPMVEAEVQLYAEQTSKQLAEIKKLKSKGPIHGKR